MDPPPSIEQLTFAWWNLMDFAHFDPKRTATHRWPKKAEDYRDKLDRVATVCLNLVDGGPPDLLAVCEITRKAASDLAAKFPDDYEVAGPPSIPHEDDFQVAFIYRSGIGLKPERPLLATETEDVSRETRPMLSMGLTFANAFVWFIACHWPGRNEKSTQTSRRRLADVLRRELHAFLHCKPSTSSLTHHAVVLGDLNEEPMAELFESELEATRDRYSSRKPPHPRHQEKRRVRLYNLAWRYLGEQVPHSTSRPLTQGPAGTWFGEFKGWKTFDHVLVSGSLLGENPPYIDEAGTRIVAPRSLVNDYGRPVAYQPGRDKGVSDHLPIVGRIVLQGDTK